MTQKTTSQVLPGEDKKSESEKECKKRENSTLTEKSVDSLLNTYCSGLYTSAGEVSKAEKNYNGQNKLYNSKECLFLWTEENYRRYRNTDINLGVKLLQTNDLIKDSISGYNKWNTDLSSNLKKISVSVKDVKAKLYELRDAGIKLDQELKEKRNEEQNKILNTAYSGSRKKPDETVGNSQVSHRGAAGINASDGQSENCTPINFINELTCIPQGLASDIDAILTASSDVTGIQMFSNISSLDSIQKSLSENSKVFEKQIQDIIKARETDLKKMQDDLVKASQEISKSEINVYKNRSDFRGALKTVININKCSCNAKPSDGACGNPRLQDFSSKISEFCKEIQGIYNGKAKAQNS